MHSHFKHQLNRAAETHFCLRPALVKALEQFLLSDDTRMYLGRNYANYAELWTAENSDKFFDMATMIRFGSAIEGCLKWYYMLKKGYANNLQLKDDPAYDLGIFQRVQKSQKNGVIRLYRKELGYNLVTNPHLSSIQETMIHRHLYAHNSGLLDDCYIKKLKKVTGQALSKDPRISQSYPAEDLYWFEPLKRLPHLIEEARRFFDAFP